MRRPSALEGFVFSGEKSASILLPCRTERYPAVSRFRRSSFALFHTSGIGKPEAGAAMLLRHCSFTGA
jgi:hypothetical protein